MCVMVLDGLMKEVCLRGSALFSLLISHYSFESRMTIGKNLFGIAKDERSQRNERRQRMRCSVCFFGQADPSDLSLSDEASTVVSRLPPCDRGQQIPFAPDDSGVLVCFLPLPKPSTCLPVLCPGSVSVHTAVSGLRLQ